MQYFNDNADIVNIIWPYFILFTRNVKTTGDSLEVRSNLVSETVHTIPHSYIPNVYQHSYIPKYGTFIIVFVSGLWSLLEVMRLCGISAGLSSTHDIHTHVQKEFNHNID